LKQQLVELQAQVGETESGQVEALTASLQDERERRRQEVAALELKFSSENNETRTNLESEFGRQKNELVLDFENQVSFL
jgi:hypothetical protein